MTTPFPGLGDDEVHVWAVRLGGPVPARVAAWLSPEERARASRFRRPGDRAGFVATRGAARALAGRYLGCHPARVAFRYGPRGKPFIEPVAGRALRIGVSHAATLALLAFASERDLGVDVEEIRPVDVVRAGPAVLTDRELAAVQSSPEADRPAAYFELWTRKEAVVKAAGGGVAGMKALDLARASEQDPLAPVSYEGRAWTALPLPPIPGYAAALVCAGGPARVRCLRLLGEPEHAGAAAWPDAPAFELPG